MKGAKKPLMWLGGGAEAPERSRQAQGHDRRGVQRQGECVERLDRCDGRCEMEGRSCAMAPNRLGKSLLPARRSWLRHAKAKALPGGHSAEPHAHPTLPSALQ